jgi:hypothetical protein
VFDRVRYRRHDGKVVLVRLRPYRARR